MSIISQDLVELLKETCESSECEDTSFSVRKNYSGRFMDGKTCLGFCVGRNADWLDLFDMFKNVNSYLFEKVEKELRELKSCARSDSMGLNQIFYFPGKQFPKNFIEEE